MKPVSPALLALLATRQFYRVTLYTFQLVGGGVLRYCSGDRSITYLGNTFSAGGATGPYFELDGEKSMAHWKAGLEVDTFDVSVAPGTGTVSGLSFFNAIKQGLFDGADVTVERLYMPTYGDTSPGSIVLFNGTITAINPAGASRFTMTLSSWIERLNMNFPRNLYQQNCINTLGDPACGIDLSAFAVPGVVLAGGDAGLIYASFPQASGYFTAGKIVMTSGANNGQARGIRTFTGGNSSNFQLLVPLPVAPAPGDTFTAYPGCDKTIGTCFQRFNNLARFRGMPFIPENTTAA